MQLLFICDIVNQTISCPETIRTFPELNFVDILFTALITGGAVVGGILLTEKRNKHSLVKDAKESLDTQIDGIERILNNNTIKVTGTTFEDSTFFRYSPVQFDIVSYESLISSGVFQRFKPTSQIVISDFFSLVKEHNYLIKEIDRLLPYATIRKLHNFRQFMNHIEDIEVKLQDLEDEMLLLIPDLRSVL